MASNSTTPRSRKAELIIESILARARWLLVPFYLGLVLVLLLLLAKFVKQLFFAVTPIIAGESGEAILTVLGLVDTTFIANLLIIIILSGYESFVSKFDPDHFEDGAEWVSKVGFSGLKIKLIGSIVAISAIDVLKYFINVDAANRDDMTWALIIHVTLTVTGLLFALTDRVTHK